MVRIDGQLLGNCGVFVLDGFQSFGLVSLSLQQSLFSLLVCLFAVFEPILLLFLFDLVVLLYCLVIRCLECESALSFVEGSLLLLLNNALLLPLVELLDVGLLQCLDGLFLLLDVLVLAEGVP